jgi:hypothetical protein
VMVTATAAIEPSSIVVGTTDGAKDNFDPMPDETVLKTGWLSKKGRRGVCPL